MLIDRRSVNLITEDSLKKEYNISKKQLDTSGMTIDDLNYIIHDFECKKEKYGSIMLSFVKDYLSDLEEIGIHSFRTRVKNADHLAAKIVRKKHQNYSKYKLLDKENYEKYLTDLIGIRCFILFKADWVNFHNYILSKFENNSDFYIKDCIRDFDSDINHNYIAEAPKAHIRNGDDRLIYEKELSPDCVLDDKIYRSVHYIIKYQGVYLEVQVRTLFEEGWGEINHALVYPHYEDDPVLKQYTELLNRLSGLADEMGTFFNVLKPLEEKCLGNSFLDEDEQIQTGYLGMEVEKTVLSNSDNKELVTYNDILENVLKQD